jgi:hypothetical protein
MLTCLSDLLRLRPSTNTCNPKNAWLRTCPYAYMDSYYSYGFLWILMDSYGFLWIPMDSYEFLRIPMDSQGFLRIPKGSYVFLRIPKDS